MERIHHYPWRQYMKYITAVAVIGLLAMSSVLIYGFTAGNFSVEGGKLMAMAWGIVSLVDLYVGFALFSCWIVFRERAWLPSIFWVVLVMVLGFWAGALYTLLALRSSGGDWKHFWLGKWAETEGAS
jgi:magnesium-transporting ATPase (P-type)